MKWWRIAGLLVLGLLTGEVVYAAALRYFLGSDTPPDVVLANGYAHPFLMIHVTAGCTALLLGPLQLIERLRLRHRRFHRALGLGYCAACFISAPAALMLALGTQAGPIAGAGFAVAALLLALFTALGLREALAGRFASHRRWMLRSYAVTSTAITLRLMLPAAGLAGIGFFSAYGVIAWVSWLTNLAVVEAFLRSPGAAATAPSARPA